VRSLFAQYLDPSCRVLVEFADHRFLVDPKDTQIGFKLMRGRAWQRAELEGAIAKLKACGRFRSGGTFLDVGSNIGTQTVYALLSGAFSRAVAIEAEPANYALLTRNIELNGFADRVAIVHCAASDRAGKVALRLNPTNAGGHSVAGRGSRRPAPTLEVAAETVDQILSKVSIHAREISLAWIDVEGHELNVLEGMASLLDARPPLVLEYAGSLHGQDGAERLKRYLAGRYESVVVLGSRPADVKPVAVRLADFAPGSAFCDLLIY
jgi:FkbM family methyltransferase